MRWESFVASCQWQARASIGAVGIRQASIQQLLQHRHASDGFALPHILECSEGPHEVQNATNRRPQLGQGTRGRCSQHRQQPDEVIVGHDARHTQFEAHALQVVATLLPHTGQDHRQGVRHAAHSARPRLWNTA